MYVVNEFRKKNSQESQRRRIKCFIFSFQFLCNLKMMKCKKSEISLFLKTDLNHFLSLPEKMLYLEAIFIHFLRCINIEGQFFFCEGIFQFKTMKMDSF
mgnify:CR=1 FL=1